MFQKLRKALFNNLQLKLIGLGIAVAIWFYASSRLREEATLRVPVNISLPQGYELLHQSHEVVQLRLRGPQFLIQRRQEEASQNGLRMRARLEEGDFEEGVVQITINPGWLSVPERELVQMSVGSMSPQRLSLFVSKTVKRRLPVRVQLTGKPREGYEVRSREGVPPEVTVTGPRTVLEQMEDIGTQGVSIWDARNDIHRIVALELEHKTTIPSPGRRDRQKEVTLRLKAEPSEVATHVQIAAESATRAIEDVPVLVLRPPKFPYEVQISEEESAVTVTFAGLPQDVRRLQPGDVSVYVDLKNLKEEKIAPGESVPYREKVQALLRSDVPVRIENIKPDQITIELRNPAE